MQINKFPEKSIYVAASAICVIVILAYGFDSKLKSIQSIPEWKSMSNGWKGTPDWSPDRRFCAVHTSARDLTLILKGNDFSKVSTVNSYIFPTWSPDSKYFAVRERSVLIYDPLSGKMVKRFKAAPPISFSWSPIEHKIAVADGYNLSIGDLKRNVQVYLKSHPADFRFDEPVWSPDGKKIAALAFNTSIESKTKHELASVLRVWNVDSSKLLFSICNLPSWAHISWSPNGAYFLYSLLGEVRVLNSDTFEPVCTIKTTDSVPVNISWAPDGKKMVIKDDDKLRFFSSDNIGTEMLLIRAKANGVLIFLGLQMEKYILINGHSILALVDSRTGEYLGYRECNGSKAEWTSDSKSILLGDFDSELEFVSLRLPQIKRDVSPFIGGGSKSPLWSNYPRPKNLEECFAAYDKGLNVVQREYFKRLPEKELCRFGGGSFISDSLLADVDGQWGKAELTKFFYKYGIYDSRNMNGILVESYWRYLNNKNSNFEKQVKKYIDYRVQNRLVSNIDSNLHKEIVDCKISGSNGGTWSFGLTTTKLKFVTFVNTEKQSCLDLLRCLGEWKKKYSSRDLEITVLIVPPDSFRSDPSASQRGSKSTEEQISDVKKILGSGTLVARIPEKLCKALNRHKPYLSKFVLYAPPQTLILKDTHKATVMISGFDNKWTEKLIKYYTEEK